MQIMAYACLKDACLWEAFQKVMDHYSHNWLQSTEIIQYLQGSTNDSGPWWAQCVWLFVAQIQHRLWLAGDLVVLIKEGVSAITDSVLGSMDIPVEEAEEATKAAAAWP